MNLIIITIETCLQNTRALHSKHIFELSVDEFRYTLTNVDSLTISSVAALIPILTTGIDVGMGVALHTTLPNFS